MLPLSERSADTRLPVATLLSWHQQAVARAAAVGSQHADADQGATAEELLVSVTVLLSSATCEGSIVCGIVWSLEVV